jgi:hypothetical protein
MSTLYESLDAWFAAEEARDAEEHKVPHLHYSSDLEPDACERSAYLRLRGAKKKPLTLPEKMMFAAGHRVEALVLDAVAAAGRLVARQGIVRPMRPSAWAWSGRFDAIVRERALTGEHRAGATGDGPGHVVTNETEAHVLVDVKTARANAFKRRDAFPKTGHLWQLSAYFHALRSVYPKLVRAELWVCDRDGSNAPVVVPVTQENGRLVPEEAIVAEEARKAPLALPTTPLPALREAVVTSYRCAYCPYKGVSCRPEEHPAYVDPDKKRPRTPRKVLSKDDGASPASPGGGTKGALVPSPAPGPSLPAAPESVTGPDEAPPDGDDLLAGLPEARVPW